jgi:hypothetical protein
MSHATKDCVLETTTTTGTGTLTLAGAVTGWQTFAAVGDGNTCCARVYEVDGDGNPSGAWEVFFGTYTSSGTTLSRTTVLASSTGSAINFGAGTKRVGLVDPAARTALPDVQVFTGNGTWTKPVGVNIQWVQVFCVAGGGGGGSGMRGGAGTNRCGGCGGSGGGRSLGSLPASACGATETVTIGAGGAGGAAQTADSTAGNIGSHGGDTSFGSLVLAQHGNRGSGGSTSGDNAPEGGYADFVGQMGGDTQTGGAGLTPQSTTSYRRMAGGGGGGGGSINTGNTAADGGAGGTRSISYDGAGAGAAGTAGGAGGAGGNVAANAPQGGAGGGGGAANAGGAGGTGGAGGLYGGGGGGGGASTNGSNSGAGGAGAAGICVVVSW